MPGAVIGAHFGQYGIWSRYHTGLDFRASYGTPIRAVKAGVVLFAGNSGDWAGNHVAIRHADGKTTMSSHMSSMAVRPARRSSAGQVIGYVGQTGRAFGAHLHFELYPVGVKYGDVYKAIDPQPWLGPTASRPTERRAAQPGSETHLTWANTSTVRWTGAYFLTAVTCPLLFCESVRHTLVADGSGQDGDSTGR